MSLTEDQDLAGPTGEQGATPADPPAADEGVKSLTDAVLSALDGPEASPTSASEPGTEAAEAVSESGEAQNAEKSESEEGTEKTALTDEEMAQLPVKTRARIDDLITQRRELRGELTGAKAELDEIRPQAENYARIQRFLRDNDLSPQDAGQALSLAGLIQTNPAEAFRRIQPIYAQLAQKIGAALPADLAEDVRLGRITQQRAYELSQARAASQISQQQVARQGQREQERAEQERQNAEVERRQNHARSMARVGDTLAGEKAQTDPDWKLKEPLVSDALEIDLHRNGMPVDEADLRKRFSTAYEQVTKRLASFRPAPKPTVKSPLSSSSPATSAPAPKSVQEAVLRALE